MVEADGLRAAARALLEAHETRRPVAPLTETYPGLTPDDAYTVQQLVIDSWAAEGRRVRGYKVGLTSQAMQRMLGVDQPDYGFLTDGMYLDEGSAVSIAPYIAPRIEPEIAVILSRDLRGPGLTTDDLEGSVGAVVGSLEVIDSRIADWRITLADTIADNASSAAVVVGRTTAPLADIDVVGLEVTLTRNGVVVGSGDGAAVLGSPLNAVLWLANRLGEFGVVLEAGSVVLPGSVCGAVPVAAGDEFAADFGPLGVVSIAFTE